MKCSTSERHESFRVRLNGELLEETKDLKHLRTTISAGGEIKIEMSKKMMTPVREQLSIIAKVWIPQGTLAPSMINGSE